MMGDLQEYVEVICFIFLTLLIVFGTVGNIVSLVIWSRGSNSKLLVCSTYFKLVSVSDICVLLLPGIYELLRLYPVRYVLTEYNDFLCKSVTFGRLFMTQISTWLVVAVTIERVSSILFPLKYNLAGARKRAYMVGLIISIFSCLVNSLFFFGMDIKFDQKGQLGSFYSERQKESVFAQMHGIDLDILNGSCNYEDKNAIVGFQNLAGTRQQSETFTDFLNRTTASSTNETDLVEERVCDFVNLPRTVERVAWTVNYVVMICVMPLSIIILCNIAILFRLSFTHRPLNSATKSNKSSLAVLTRLVLAIGIVFTLSTLPMALYVLRHLERVGRTLDVLEIDILPTVARSLFCLNNGTNFILYFSSGEKFREDCKHLFKSVFKCCRHTRKINLELIQIKY